MADPTTTNAPASEADVIIKDIEAILVPLIESALQGLEPALAAPVIKQVTDTIEQGVANELTAYFENFVTFQIIDHQTESEESNLSTALKALIAAEQSGDASAIQQAIQNYANANSALLASDGSSTAH